MPPSAWECEGMGADQPGRCGAERAEPTGRRIVLTTVGSLGDLHPYLAIALGLKGRGHEAIVATSACYRSKVVALGLGYRALRPDSDTVSDPAAMARFMHHRWGTARCLREYILPVVRASFEDTLAAAEGADLLVAHTITYATRLAAEVTGIPWVSTILTPSAVWSALDPPLLPGFPGLSKALRPLGPRFWGPTGRILERATRSWAGPLDRLRREVGLPPTDANPLTDGHSPWHVLAPFSEVLAPRQPDWPPQTVVTGFPFFDRDGEARLPAELERFLESGPAPIVFTLGISAATVGGRFFEASAAAAQALGRRAVLVGPRFGRGPSLLPDDIFLCEYAPFSQLFPRAAAIVHAGGIGTTGLAMRAGRPILVVPFAHDQPDNAERLRRLGAARTLFGPMYSAARATAALGRLLDDPAYARAAAEVRARMSGEDGVRAACDALEVMLRQHADDERSVPTVGPAPAIH
jgi:UDP:flavonoid glycosyltransferase YjiC (YdhE family)